MPVQTFCVHASPAEYAQVEQVAQQGRTPQKVAARARIILMLANHEPPASVAEALRISRMTVRRWADHFVSDGVPGLLRDASCPGRRKQITPGQVDAIVEAAVDEGTFRRRLRPLFCSRHTLWAPVGWARAPAKMRNRD